MKTTKNLKSWIWKFCLLVVLILFLPTTAFAQGIITDDSVAEGEVLDKNIILNGTDVVMDGVINGDVLAIGETVTINGEINGNLIVIAKKAVLNGPVSGSVYASVLTLVLGPQASIGRDLYFIGAGLETSETSSIKRDLVGLSLEAKIAGMVERRVNTLVGPVNLLKSIYEFLLDKGFAIKPLFPSSRFVPDGMEKPASMGIAFGLPSIKNLALAVSVSAGRPVVPGNVENDIHRQGAIDVERLQSWLIPRLRSLVALLIVGFLLVWLLPAQLSFSVEKARTGFWRSLFTGLAVWVFGWIIALLLTLLILGLTIFFYWISLPNLAFLIGAFGLGSIGVALSIFWISIVFVSKIIVATLVGKLIFSRFIPKHADSRVWPFLLGVIIYVLIASIPYLGWVVATLATLVGLGALWGLISQRRLPKVEAEAPLQPAETSLDANLIAEE